MPTVDFVIEPGLSNSIRARQVRSMFDVPADSSCKLKWKGSVPIEDFAWNIGLIVGPSGCGKTTIARQLFGEFQDLRWDQDSVIDDFADNLTVEQIAKICGAVGFNTIPAWLRAHRVLSNGERFRVDLARRMLELSDPVVVDEFSSVVDRQVARIASHAVQKWTRRNNRKFVAVSCHFDIVDWLQPDWVLEPATMAFERRSVQQRPTLKGWVKRVGYEHWQLFAPYHYLSAEMNKAARCYALFVEGTKHPVAFTGILYRPHPRTRNLVGISRTVTLPDWQGLGLTFILNDTIGAGYKALGYRLHHYPAHPSFIRSLAKSKSWKMVRTPLANMNRKQDKFRRHKGVCRPCAVFEYVGPALERERAAQLITVPGGSKMRSKR